MTVNAKTRPPSKATTKQLAVLKQLYNFRFGTTDLLARSLGLKDGRYIHTRVEALVSQGYIGKNYDATYKLSGKPATYYLIPKAFAALKRLPLGRGEELSDRTLKNAYKDKVASKEFIDRKLAIFTISDRLRAMSEQKLRLWTKDQLNLDKYHYFPKPLPDLYLRLMPPGSRPRERDFMLYYLDDHTPFFVHARRLQKLIDYVEEEKWEAATKSQLRGALLVCESMSLLKRIRKTLAQSVDEDDIPKFYYTTLPALKRSTHEDDEIWQVVGRPLELFGLTGF